MRVRVPPPAPYAMTKLKLITVHTLPFLVGIALSYLFWGLPNLLLLFYLALTALVVWYGKDRWTESLIFLYGIAAGFVVETLGTQVSGYQSFALPQVLGIPYWLLVSWGYGFILMKRIGLIIGTGSPWTVRP